MPDDAVWAGFAFGIGLESWRIHRNGLWSCSRRCVPWPIPKRGTRLSHRRTTGRNRTTSSIRRRAPVGDWPDTWKRGWIYDLRDDDSRLHISARWDIQG